MSTKQNKTKQNKKVNNFLQRHFLFITQTNLNSKQFNLVISITARARFKQFLTISNGDFFRSSCPVDEKLISRFRGSWSESGIFETQVFAYMKTFRFTGSPALYIECDVRMCHGRCPVNFFH